MSDNDKADIPFEDIPPRARAEHGADGADSADRADSARSADGGAESFTGSRREHSPETDSPETENAGGRVSEERTTPGSGSTGPAGVREDLGTLADEARKLWSALEARVVAPAVQSYPEVARHLGAAGREVAAAIRSAVRGSEQSWRDGPGGDEARQQEKITVERVDRIDPSEKKNRD